IVADLKQRADRRDDPEPKIEALWWPELGGRRGAGPQARRSEWLDARVDLLGCRLLVDDDVPPCEPERAGDEHERHQRCDKAFDEHPISDSPITILDLGVPRRRHQGPYQPDEDVFGIDRLELSHPVRYRD